MSSINNESAFLSVPPTEQTGPDNFIMKAARLDLLVTPQITGNWVVKHISKNLKEMESECDPYLYNHIDVGFEGEVNGEPGFQIAVISYMLTHDYEWFGNGIDAIRITDEEGKEVIPKDFEYFISVINKKTIELTIEVVKQVKISPKNIHFRFKAHEPGTPGEDEFKTVVLVSEDPVVTPNRPIDD